VEHKGGPTVILAKTVKGYGLGDNFEARNPRHQQKKLKEEDVKYFLQRFEIPIPDEAAQRRRVLSSGRFQPRNRLHARAPARRWAAICPTQNLLPRKPKRPSAELIEEFAAGSKGTASFHDHGFRQAC
jgi:pyruvate dehydrogenase E1 component